MSFALLAICLVAPVVAAIFLAIATKGIRRHLGAKRDFLQWTEPQQFFGWRRDARVIGSRALGYAVISLFVTPLLLVPLGATWALAHWLIGWGRQSEIAFFVGEVCV